MSETTPPRTNLERELVRIWEQVLQRAPIGIREDFFDLGGTSSQAVRIFARIEELVHHRLPLSLILGAPTIEQLALSLLPGKSRDRKAYVVPIQSEGEKPVFFCVGEGVLWRPLSEHLGADQPVLNVGLDPGVIDQMKGPNPMEKLARHMVSAICEKQPQGPYYLGGFCCEAVFAYEVARQLTMYGHEVGLLVLVEPFTPSENAIARFATSLKRVIFRTGFRFRELYRSGIGEFPQYALSRWKGLKTMWTDALWRKSARDQVLKQQSSSPDLGQIVFVAASSYKPKPLGCRTVIVHCKDWPMLSAGDPYFGWRKYLTGPTGTIEVPGDHIGLFRDPGVGVLAEKLRVCLQNTKQVEIHDFDMVIEVDRRLYSGPSRA
ncbi:MAG TPA: phosphopantetheine-binding protein [Verrucomicrobiae bacterium]|nr:phosphopantetheine-binding protein [Verrucomicrobiae bacterium]